LTRRLAVGDTRGMRDSGDRTSGPAQDPDHGVGRPATPSSVPEAPSLATPGGVRALQQAIGNAAMGRLLRSRVLARDFELDPSTFLRPMDTAAAERELGPNDRPPSKNFWNAYSQVSYEKWHGEEQRNNVWEFVGGSVGKMFENQNTCACRVSYGFNYGGWPITGGLYFVNYTNVVYKGKAGDGKNYIVGAPAMEKFLTKRWGPPDAKLKTNADATTFEGTLADGQTAIFAGDHHSGIIMKGHKDAYVQSDPDVMPVSAWKLP
jgi:hypothetical protein